MKVLANKIRLKASRNNSFWEKAKNLQSQRSAPVTKQRKQQNRTKIIVTL